MLNIQEAKTHLSRYVDLVAEEGQTIIIAKAGKPMAKLVPYKVARAPRQLGRLAGQVPAESPDCWDSDEHSLDSSALFHGEESVSMRVAEEPK